VIGCDTAEWLVSNMKERLKYYLVKTLLSLVKGAGTALSWLGGFFSYFIFPFAFLGRGFYRYALLPLFRLLLVIRRLLQGIAEPIKNNFISIFARRQAIHGIITVIVMSVSVFNLQSRTVSADTFGDGSFLQTLINGDTQEEYIQEKVDYSDSNSGTSSYLGSSALSVSQLYSNVQDTFEDIEEPRVAVLKSSTPTETTEFIPSRSKIENYVVQDGDTLWDISKKFGIDVPTLLTSNDLGPKGLIRPGDSLVILPVSGVRHVVKNGDTLTSIAKKYQVEANDISKFNKLSVAAALNVGDSLIVPGGSVETVAPKPVAKPKPVTVAVAPRENVAAPIEKLFTEPVKPAASTASGERVWPSQGHYVTQPFKGKKHTGIDIDGQIGSPNYAMSDGTVEFAGWSVGYGLSIVINHGNGLWTRYGHNSKIYVKIGDEVKAGQTIALMGSTGKSTGSHLHFEVLSGPGKFLNPLKYVR